MYTNRFKLKRPSMLPWYKAGVYSLVLATVAIFSGCATPIPQNVKPTPTIVNNERGVPNYYHVRAGDTVSQIAGRYGLSIGQIKELNHLDSQYTIYVGQWLKLWQDNSGQRPVVNNRHTAGQSHNRQVPNTSATTSSGYRYPTSNAVIHQYDSNTGVMGMWFAGQIGDPVVASQSGTVLYTGDGLLEYGNLVMIRHDSEYVTAYAHNDRILVKEGEQVQAGQRIATMGNSGSVDQVALEFQVRRNGRPVDPKTVLSY
ncbi:M23 family metallopeptidase [Psychrobacter sp. I-STPA6b]|uniref:M23 family metallopeptidase n=1 Tax=Psychrobacter sp. I-STPA6b TaxID=2585718 RepID=UPI001D0CBA74|nr:M23 family metallopeptidase [Psychrobacter sp. I-STPA6b]